MTSTCTSNVSLWAILGSGARRLGRRKTFNTLLHPHLHDRCLATTMANIMMYKSLGHKANLIYFGTAIYKEGRKGTRIYNATL